MRRSDRLKVLQYLMLLVFLAVGAYLRLADLRTNPGWYPDEGSDLNIAWNLWHGRLQYFAVGGSLLVAARAPLFHIILAGLFSIFGYDIVVARMFGAAAGVATIPLLYFCLKSRIGEWEAMTVAGLFSVFPLAVLYNRWAFAYNLLMPLFVISFWALLRLMESGQKRWMLCAALAISLSILTAWVSLPLLICLALIGWIYSRRALLWGLPVAVSLPAVFLIASYSYAPGAFAQDLSLTFSRTGGSLLAQIASTTVNFSVFIASNSWLPLGIIGLFFVEPRRVRGVIFAIFFLTLFSIIRFSPVSETGFHRLLELVPFLVLGITTLFWRGIPYAIRVLASDLDRFNDRLGLDGRLLTWTRRGLKLGLILGFVFVVFMGVVLTAVLFDFLSVQNGFSTRIDDVLAVPSGNAASAIHYVNEATNADDVVLASPQLGWALHARAVDFQQVLSYEGYVTDNYPTPIQRVRFVFDPTPENASYAIVDPMWRVWAPENIPAMQLLLNAVQEWQVAFSAGEFVVYRNPHK
jgi:4-amino-4-deoxy-L-arabinose transferase-like glycosyltransferase